MKKKILFIILILLIVAGFELHAGLNPNPEIEISSDSSATNLSLPFVGAQVIIEPGQAPEEIDTWFRVLKERSMLNYANNDL